MQERRSRGFSSGDILQIIQIVIMVSTLGAFYQQFKDGLAQVSHLQQQVERIEHYLSSKDSHYWDRVEGKP